MKAAWDCDGSAGTPRPLVVAPDSVAMEREQEKAPSKKRKKKRKEETNRVKKGKQRVLLRA